MSTFYSVLQALGWTLIHSLWQGTVLAIFAFVLAATAGSSKLRYWIYCSALAAIMALAVFTIVERTREPATLPVLHSPVPIQFEPQAATVESSVNSGRLVPSSKISSSWFDSIAFICGALWLVGALLMIARAAIAAAFLRSLRKSAVAFADLSLCLKAEQWARELGIQRTVKLCAAALTDVPAVIGHWKPMLLLPAALLAKLTPGQLEALILHELMHIRRNDFLVNLLQVACETILFFHPAAWFLSAAIRREREHSCDDFAAQRTGRIPYARALLELEEARRQLTPQM